MLVSACFCQQAAMSAYEFTPYSVASPDAPQKPLVRKRAHSGGANWVQVTHQMSPSTAKRPHTAGLQQPACTHEEHQILSTAEATSFASQFWDCEVHPTKASQQEFLATCIDVDSEKNVKHAQWHKWKGSGREQQCGRLGFGIISGPLCIALSRVSFAVCSEIWSPTPPPPTFLKRPFLTDFKK